jgi:hypothetical protein
MYIYKYSRYDNIAGNVADPGCLYRRSDTDFSHSGSRNQQKRRGKIGLLLNKPNQKIVATISEILVRSRIQQIRGRKKYFKFLQFYFYFYP